MKLSQVRKLSPQGRLVYWMTEREAIRLKKGASKPKPWTDDEILQQYRFCNVRRMDDKVSTWLYTQWYKPFRDHPNMVPAVSVARHFNLPRSLVGVSYFLFEQKRTNWDEVKIYLKSAKIDGPIFNGAYMVRGIGEVDKVDMVIDRVTLPLVDKPPAIDSTSMANSVEALLPYWGFSSFMAGQVVADLRWALTGSWKDKTLYAPIGPGSKRGMNRLHSRPIDQPLDQSQFRDELITLMIDLRRELPLSIASRLEAMDYQNCLCEFDKYTRALTGEGRPKQRYQGV